jgi:hypothetical protein
VAAGTHESSRCNTVSEKTSGSGLFHAGCAVQRYAARAVGSREFSSTLGWNTKPQATAEATASIQLARRHHAPPIA